uniref:Chlorohydrolase/aminohydrolase n=1 Tax=uncultured Chloroflexota bacterium TaxID=166587 RepID=H5SK79_9CHLR|nr:chlorohydrolase/aminohydrolase [uncultured bacterium]BAL56565.1 chlorohydrolase/aminohydrolase [uncultured Chloroflexota bacterium]
MLITHANLITWEKPNRILEDHALYIEGGLIRELGPNAVLEARYPQAERLDARGQWVMPGNICAHTHFYGAFARGLAIPGSPPRNFYEILKKLWWPLDQALDEGSVRLSALVCLLDAIKHGTTMLIDHHASPNFIEGSLEAIGEEVERAGVRAVLCYEVTDRYGEEKARQAIQENVRFIEASRHSALLRGTFGLHAPLTLSRRTLEACLQAAPAGSGFHIHVAESTDDRRTILAREHVPPIIWLSRLGILGPETIVAHAIHLDEEEMRLLAERGAWVSHQPRSNMNNGVGVAAVEKMQRMGVRLCLGNDGFSNAMWEEWMSAYLLHKVAHLDPRRMNGYDLVEMAIYNNAALAMVFFPEQTLGRIVPGAAADLIFVQYHPYTPLTAENLPWHILFGFRESMVTTTIVAGKVLMRDRQLLTLDEEAISAQARRLAPQVWERYARYVP